MKERIKKYFALILSTTLIFTSAQINVSFAADNSKLLVHYNMTHTNGKLTDVTGNGYDADMVNVKESDFASGDEGTALNFDATEKYVKIPKGTIQGEAFTIESTFKSTTNANHWLWTLGTTVASWPNVKNYLFINPLSAQGGYVGKVLAGIKDTNTELRSDPLTPNASELNTVVAVFNNGDLTVYLNGVATKVMKSGYSIQNILKANSTEDFIGYIGRSLYSADPYYKGSLYDFRIYNTALSESEIKSNYEINQERYLNLAKENLNIDNIDNVYGNITLPIKGQYNTQIKWTSSDSKIITETGIVNKPANDTTVTLTANLILGSHSTQKVFVAKVKSQNGTLNIAKDRLIVNNIEDVRGNLTLPTIGEYNTKITWKSSDSSVITDTAAGDISAGVVTRQSSDTKVTLTATLTLDSESVQKVFIANVKAKPKKVNFNDYLFAYFIGQNGPNEEQIYFASSKDGLKWNELNDSKPVLTSKLGEKGVRDPFIMRSPEGDKFYLIATDLSIYNRKGDWGGCQTAGSQYIMVWESTDLVNWSNQRMVKIAPSNAGCTWAPEAFYDESTGEYIVFWASKVDSDGYAKQRVYYCKTRDFYTFTEPKVWLEESYSVIDCTVIKDETTGYYYRFTKNESKTYIYLERSKSLMGSFEKVSGWNNITGAEGPTCYKLNGENEWILLVDYFGKNGYYPYKIKDLNSGLYSKLEDGSYNLPSKPRHGTVIPITSEEYSKVMSAYGSLSIDFSQVPSVVMQGADSSVFPKTIKLGLGGIDDSQKTYDVDWNITKDSFANVGLVNVTGTVKSEPNQTITKQVLVVRKNVKYFVNSAVDLTNGGKSDYYDSLASQTTLLNSKPDQEYDGTWGHTSYEWYKSDASLGINNSGFYGANDGSVNPTYKVKLNSGKYCLDSMQYEWWTGPRTTEVHILYKDSDGTEKDIALGNSTVNSNSRIGMVSGEFEINKDNTEATIIFKRKTGDAGVVSYFTIADINTKEKSPYSLEIAKNDTVLTAKLSNEDGSKFTTEAAVKYEWYRDDKLVEGENSAIYNLSNEDRGKKIKVKVQQYNLTSEYINISDDSHDKVPTTLELTRDDDTLTGILRNEDGSKFTTDAAVKYEWYRDDETVKDENNYKYKLSDYDKGKKIKACVPQYKLVSEYIYISDESHEKAPETLEIKRDDDTLTAILKNEDGSKFTTDAAVKYEWYRDGEPIKNEDNYKHKLSNDDKGKKIKVRVPQYNLVSNYIYISADPTEPTKPIKELKLAKVKIKGIESVGETLEAQLLTEEGTKFTTSSAVSYEWHRLSNRDSASGKLVGKDETYKLVSSDKGNYIKLAVRCDGKVFEAITSKIAEKPSSGSSSHHKHSSKSSSGEAVENSNTNTSVNTNSKEVDKIKIQNNEDGTIKLVNQNGQIVTGWQQLNDKWYLADLNGKLETGWQNVNGTWYYLKADGTMTTGWQEVGGTWYYLKDDGGMATGWQNVNGAWYYLKVDGVMATGWQEVNGVWYYLKANGAMASNTVIDGYSLDESGALIK